MVTNFRIKIGEIGLLALAFQNEVEYSKSDLKSSMAMIWLHRVKMVNFGPVIPEFTRVICVYPSSIGSSAAFAWRRHC